MAIRFPPERRQPPPHYYAGPRRSDTPAVRTPVRATAFPEAVRIAAAPRAPIAFSGAAPVDPHTIVFTTKRPPPGTVVVAVAPRVTVRAIVHAAANIPVRVPVLELRGSSPTEPHAIVFASSIAPPRAR